MSCPNKYQKSSFRAYNTVEQSFTNGGYITYPNVAYKSGVSISLNGDNSTISLKNPGLYFVTIDTVVSNSATADTIVQLYHNGTAVTGALSEVSIPAAGDFATTTISAVIPVSNKCPCMAADTINFGVTGTTGTVEGVNVNVIKIA